MPTDAEITKELSDVRAGLSTGGVTYGRTPKGIVDLRTNKLVETGPAGGDITLPDLAEPVKAAALPAAEGLSTSVPAVNRAQLEAQLKEQFTPQRLALSEKLQLGIVQETERGAQVVRGTEAELGTRRRFDSAARAFVDWQQEQANKRIQALEVQKREALAAFDMDLAGLVEKRIASERTTQQQDFENTLKIIEEARKQKETKDDKTTQAKELSKKEADIFSLYTKGITNIGELQQGLRIKYPDITSTEVNTAIKNLTVTGKVENLGNDLETFNWLEKNNRLPSSISSLPENERYLAWVRVVNKAEKPGADVGGIPLTPGKGAKTSTEENIIRTRLFAKLMNIINKGQVSDTDRKIIDERIAEFRNAGMGEQEIMDSLAGFATEVQTPYNQTFRDLIVTSTDTADQQTQLMGKVAILLNGGNYIGAMKAVEGQAMIQAKKLDDENYMGNATAENYLRKINRVREIAKEGGIGVISGTFSNVVGRLRGEQAAKLKAELTALYAQFRKEQLGTAVTESEAKFLSPLLGDISDRKANFGEKLDSFERMLLDRYNGTRNSVNLPQVKTRDIINDNKKLDLYSTNEVTQVGGTDDDFFNAPLPTGGNAWNNAPTL